MAFSELLGQWAPQMIEEIAQNAGAAAGLIGNHMTNETNMFNTQANLNSQYQANQLSFANGLNMQQNAHENAMDIQDSYFNNAQMMQNSQQVASFSQMQSQQNFLGSQFQANRDLQSQQFTANQQLASQLQTNHLEALQSLQNARFTQQSQMQNVSLTAQGLMGLGNLASNFAGAGLGFLSNIQQAGLARQNFDYMTSKASDAYTQEGLPGWLAFNQNPAMLSALPRTTQMVSGMNGLTSAFPGNPMNTPWTGSDSQTTFGVGDAPMSQ